jgi:TPR repeat protein
MILRLLHILLRRPRLVSLGPLSLGCQLLVGCATRNVPEYPWHEASFSASARGTCSPLAGCVAKCDAGQAEICETLGYLYETGEGVPQSYTRAGELYAQACRSGRGESCTRLAVMYDIGLSVAEDTSRAVELYRQACQLGEDWSCKRASELR